MTNSTQTDGTSEPCPSSRAYILWILVACAILHMLEEYSFNFTGWVISVGQSCSNTDMFSTNFSFLIIGICAAAVGWRNPSFSLSFPALLLWNALFHSAVTLLFGRLNPGVLTAVVLFFPVGIVSFVLAARDRVLTTRRIIIAFALGLLIHAYPLFLILMRPRLSY